MFVEPHLDPTTISLSHFASASTISLSRKQEADVRTQETLEMRLSSLDAMGVDLQVVMPSPRQCYTVLLEIASKAARIVSRAYRFSQTSPAKNCPSLPTRHFGKTAEELGALVVIHPRGRASLTLARDTQSVRGRSSAP